MIITINRPEDLVRNLRDLRKKYKVSQEELASEIKVSAASIGRYEKGITEISVNTYFRICQFFVNRHVRENVSLSLKPTNDTMTKDLPNTATSSK